MVFGEDGPLNFPNLRVVLPTASKKPVTFNKSSACNSWFDFYKLGEDGSGHTGQALLD